MVKKIKLPSTHHFSRVLFGGSSRKLGLFSAEDDDEGLFQSLFATMADTSADFTGTFRELAQVGYRTAVPFNSSFLACSTPH